MKLLRSLILALPLALSAVSARAEIVPLTEINDYLNTIVTAQGDFTQINADGTISTGRLYLRRPGRIRFEYDPPDNGLVMAGGGKVAVFDPKSNTPPEQFPLKRTPLSIILASKVDLTTANMVVGHREDGPATVIDAQDPENPEIGSISLMFTGAPVELRQWIIRDDVGNETTVILGELEKDVRLGPALFSIVQETKTRLGNN